MEERKGGRRKHVSKACQPCRESKTKCDGVHPRCGQCTRRDKACFYGGGDDKRRLSWRTALRILRMRIDALHEQLLGLNAIPVGIDTHEEALANRVLDAVDLPALPTFNGLLALENATATETEGGVLPEATNSNAIDISGGQLGGEHVPATSLPTSDLALTQPELFDDTLSFSDFSQIYGTTGFSPDWPWTTFVALEGEQQPQDLACPAYNNLNRPDAEETAEVDDVDQGLVNEIAARAGTLQIASDGKLRYFGSPANAHILTNGPRSSPRSLAVDGARVLSNSGLDQAVEPRLQRHLIDLFFSWYNSCHPVIERSFYWFNRQQHTETGESDGFYSDVLTDAMCAIGATFEGRYHHALPTFPRPLAEFFADRAKALLEIELDSPCVSTVQALLLLSSHEAAFHRTARSWLYSGMAMRLCFDLGLHTATDSYVRVGVLTPSEVEVMQMTFWASYVMNYRSSFTLGRPFTLNASDISASKPSASFQQSVWKGHQRGSSESTYFFPSEMDGTPDQIGLICEQRTFLTDMMEPLVRALYGNTKTDISALLQTFEQATTGMRRWWETLPPALRISDDRHTAVVPQILVLHLEYHYFQILVHRPWTSQRLQRPPRSHYPGFRQARNICIDHACRMARILANFEERFGYRYMDVETCQLLPSATLILIFATISVAREDGRGSEIPGYLNTFLRALDELSHVIDGPRYTNRSDTKAEMPDDATATFAQFSEPTRGEIYTQGSFG